MRHELRINFLASTKVNNNNWAKQRVSKDDYHMLENLLQLGIRMISTSFDIVISKSIAKSFVKLLEYLTETNRIHLNKKQKL